MSGYYSVVVVVVVAESQVPQDPSEESHHGRMVQDMVVRLDHFQDHLEESHHVRHCQDHWVENRHVHDYLGMDILVGHDLVECVYQEE